MRLRSLDDGMNHNIPHVAILLAREKSCFAPERDVTAMSVVLELSGIRRDRRESIQRFSNGLSSGILPRASVLLSEICWKFRSSSSLEITDERFIFE